MQIELTHRNNFKSKVENALSSSQIPHIYVNGFIIFLGHADVGMILQTNGRETCVLNMSYTTAKTIVEKLGTTIREFEETTGNTIMTTDFVQSKTAGRDENASDDQ